MSKRPRAPKKKRQGLSFLRRLAIGAVSAITTLFVIAALVAGWAVWSFQGAGPKARSGDVTVVLLRDGAGLNEIDCGASEMPWMSPVSCTGKKPLGMMM